MPPNPTQQARTLWTVKQTSKAKKGEEQLPERLKIVSRAVKRSLQATGKAAGFCNFGPLKQLGNNFYHCHINTGKPTYVMVWKLDKQIKTIILTYIGPHGSAPY
ncbi:MAG: cytotoxic translational repressor of toxin-antitoxin stability system [Solidesulfovibrio sp.]